ncbi:hypothetical protein SAMN04488003_11161 [Loktanella fryxellensis]|uniref:Uncharacterized protein n=1 Tax=Loktanella fryxellensis TaxID=245187 RepID=A0A1H8EPX6_9RHOB|nr:hypothetical protein [Loktanella fryxellensis]SEN21641.1 hypothetical protein SAMN04488003_11161 [Loktanella fryxellensis]
MSAPEPRKQKASRALLHRLFGDAANVWVIHYSCESFYERKDGRSPRITSIAIRKLDAGQTVSFSIHQVAELGGIDLTGITAQYDALERKMLDAYFAHIGSHRGMKYLHWNMRDINYGFAAIEHRYRVLGGQPYVISDDNKFDLARLLIDIYGVGYTGHPRLTTILEKNRVDPRDFLNGASEAEAFEQQNYVGLHQSTLRKVDVLANIAGRAYDRSLKTNTSWWEMHGGTLRTFLNFAAENRPFQLIAGLASIIGLAITFNPGLPGSVLAAIKLAGGLTQP